MVDIAGVLTRWGLDARQVRERMYRAPTPRERERWHALWLLAQGWSANKVAALLERDAHTIGAWLAAFAQDGPAALACAQTGGPPRPRGRGPGGAEGGGAGHAGARWASPWRTGTGRWCASSSRPAAGSASAAAPACATCTGWASSTSARSSACARRTTSKRAAFVAADVALLVAAQAAGAKRFCRGLRRTSGPTATCTASGCAKGQPALVRRPCPRWGEQASDSSAVCLETGAVAHLAADRDQLVRDQRGLPAAVARPPRRAAGRHRGPRPGPRRRRGARRPGHARPRPAPGPPAGLQPRLQPGRGARGLGARGGDGQHLPGDQGEGAGADGALLRRAGGPHRRGPIPLPPHAASAGRGRGRAVARGRITRPSMEIPSALQFRLCRECEGSLPHATAAAIHGGSCGVREVIQLEMNIDGQIGLVSCMALGQGACYLPERSTRVAVLPLAGRTISRWISLTGIQSSMR